MVSSLEPGDPVVILPLGASSDSYVREIAYVKCVRASTIQLSDGKLYAKADGRGLVTNDCILPAADVHRIVLERRSLQIRGNS